MDFFPDFNSASGASDGFADFQAASLSVGTPENIEKKAPPVNDKLNVLKALVSDTNLYTGKHKEEKRQNEEAEEEKEDWAEFAGSSSELGSKFDKFESVFSSSADKDEKSLSWGSVLSGTTLSTENKSVTSPDGEGWADFSSAPPPNDGSAKIDWSGAIKSVPKSESEDGFTSPKLSTPPRVQTQEATTMETSRKPKDLNNKDKTGSGKRYDYFGRNIANSSNLGIAALNTAPPDFSARR